MISSPKHPCNALFANTMMRHRSGFLRLAACLVGGFLTWGCLAVEVGDPAPDFRLPGSDGRQHALTDYRGKYVVIAFFPKAFTGG